MQYHLAAVICLGVLIAGQFESAQGAEEAVARPCPSESRFGEFDFWVGSWDVWQASGEKAGVNRIVKAHSGCVLVERWTGAKGGTGISLNYYNPDSDQWVQNWVGSGGTLIDIRGGLVDGSMQLEGKIQYLGQGQTNAFRAKWTLLEDGRVRQYFEESTDDGKTWQPWFEGFYSRQEVDTRVTR